jgi:hypothetical protein
MDPDPDADPDPAIFVADLQQKRKKRKKSCCAHYFLKVQEAQKHTVPTNPNSDLDLQH